MIEEFLPLIGTYGFPIFMVLWFMFRMEKIINQNTEAIKEMQRAFIDVVKQLEQLCSEMVKT